MFIKGDETRQDHRRFERAKHEAWDWYPQKTRVNDFWIDNRDREINYLLPLSVVYSHENVIKFHGYFFDEINIAFILEYADCCLFSKMFNEKNEHILKEPDAAKVRETNINKAKCFKSRFKI